MSADLCECDGSLTEHLVHNARLAARRIILRDSLQLGDLAAEEAFVVAQELARQRRQLLEVPVRVLVHLPALGAVRRVCGLALLAVTAQGRFEHIPV